jgi:hypothetical protein
MNAPQVIHSNPWPIHRLGGSRTVRAVHALWMNLWKLWIALSLLTLRLDTRHVDIRPGPPIDGCGHGTIEVNAATLVA